MNRLWLIGGILVLAIAGILGWLNAGRQDELDRLPVLASANEAGCDAPGQLWLQVGNASDRPVLSAQGVISIAKAADQMPVAVANFQVDGPVAPGFQKQLCVSLEEPDLQGADRKRVWWLARATSVEFGERHGNPLNPADQGLLRDPSR